MGSMNELIWAYGPLTNGNAMVHGTTANDRGGLANFFVIQLPSSAIALVRYTIGLAILSLLYFAF